MPSTPLFQNGGGRCQHSAGPPLLWGPHGTPRLACCRSSFPALGFGQNTKGKPLQVPINISMDTYTSVCKVALLCHSPGNWLGKEAHVPAVFSVHGDGSQQCLSISSPVVACLEPACFQVLENSPLPPVVPLHPADSSQRCGQLAC